MPATAAQIAANQANARCSTGPVTPEGKSAAARNAFRHGFRSQSVLIPGDDPAEYQTLHDELTDHFQPGDLTEFRAVREMADAEWRLRRARTHLQTLLTQKVTDLAEAEPDRNDPFALQVQAHENLTAESAYYRQLIRFEEGFQRQYDHAYRTWSKYQERRRTSCRKDLDITLKQSLLVGMQVPPISTNEANPPLPPPQQPRHERTQLPAAPTSADTPRNAPCPCGSREKYKRCCGKSAPPVLCAA